MAARRFFPSTCYGRGWRCDRCADASMAAAGWAGSRLPSSRGEMIGRDNSDDVASFRAKSTAMAGIKLSYRQVGISVGMWRDVLCNNYG